MGACVAKSPPTFALIDKYDPASSGIDKRYEPLFIAPPEGSNSMVTEPDDSKPVVNSITAVSSSRASGAVTVTRVESIPATRLQS